MTSPIVQSLLAHFNDRPANAEIDTIVIHSFYAAGAEDPLSFEACFAVLDQEKVAPHYSIAQDGTIFQNVREQRRAWHAGVSCMPFADDSRENVNNFSIGIEFIATPESGFSKAQYESCAELCAGICSRHRIRAIVGHEHIAPGRKVDPGENFDWIHFRESLAAQGVVLGALRFPVGVG